MLSPFEVPDKFKPLNASINLCAVRRKLETP
jgi:hypothetical protein